MSAWLRMTGGVLLAALVLGAGSARADRATAKQFTEQATLAYKLGHFQEALANYSKAYEEFAAPLLLFNIGQCYRELGNYERAAFFLHGYLHEVPKARNRTLVKDLIAECETKLAAEQAETRRQEEAEREQRALKLAETNLEAERQQSSGTVVQIATVDRSDLIAQEDSGRKKVISGLGVAAAGIVAAGIGAYFGARAQSDSNSVSQVATWNQAQENTYRDGSRSATTADVLYAVGAAALIAGGVVAVLGWREESSAKRALSVAGLASPAGGGMTLAWTF